MIKETSLVRILVVDDEPFIALTIKKILTNLGYLQTDIAHSEQKAKQIITNQKIDLAILDINLNGNEEGINLAKKCLALQIPFFYVSSYTDTKTLDKALETAPGAYVIKPFLKANIYSAIELTIGKKAKKEDPIITIKEAGEYYRIKQSEILYIKSDDVYIEIITATRRYLYRDSIKNFLLQFDWANLIKVHRAYAINLQHISKASATSVFIGETELPVSRTYKQNLFDRL
ncbi:MAG: DNA-binding LytR/AlgR family response regulator [Vicingaceae bacterium]